MKDDDTHEHKDQQGNTPVLRRGPSRSSKQPINYKGMFGGNQHCNNFYDNDCAFMSILDIDGEYLLSTPIYRTLSSTTYVSLEEVQEMYHPFFMLLNSKQRNMTTQPTVT